jgi:hypothetical protein
MSIERRLHRCMTQLALAIHYGGPTSVSGLRFRVSNLSLAFSSTLAEGL